MDRFIKTRNVAIIGIIANLFLLTIKLIVGFLSRSQAMIADGFNSLGDVFASLMTYIGNKIASQPHDKEHPYGHGKAEYIFSMIISFSLLIVAYTGLRNSIISIVTSQSLEFNYFLIAVAIGTIILKFILFIYTHKLGKTMENLLIIANSQDHRNDIFVSLVTLIGILLSRFGIYWVDGIVGIGIGIWIGYTGFDIFLNSYHILMDSEIEEDLKENVIEIISSIGGVDHIDDIITKPVGIRFIVIVKVSVEGNMTVNDSHHISADIKYALLKKIDKIQNVLVHKNPV